MSAELELLSVLDEEAVSAVECEIEVHSSVACEGSMFLTQYSCCNPRCELSAGRTLAVCSEYMLHLAKRGKMMCACGEIRDWQEFFRQYWLL